MQEYDFEFHMMGSDAAISIVAPTAHVAETTFERMRAIAEREEARYSRFRADSELSLLNEARTRTVSSEFMKTFLLARELSIRSRGAFNPLVDISRFGYDADIAEVRGTERTPQPSHASYGCALELVEIDEARNTITLQEGQRLDFGGFLKGRVAEMMADAAHLSAGVVVNVGGDIFTRGVDASGEPFSFAVDNPHEPLQELSFTARDTGIATSGTYNRHWKLGGRTFHHVLDATGRNNPNSDVVSATVIAKTGAEADAFATVPLVIGSVAGARALQALSLPYLLICTDGSIVTSPAFLQSVAAPFSYA